MEPSRRDTPAPSRLMHPYVGAPFPRVLKPPPPASPTCGTEVSPWLTSILTCPSSLCKRKASPPVRRDSCAAIQGEPPGRGRGALHDL
jgi:hypothetical protein